MILGISSFTYGWSIGVPGGMPVTPMNEIDLLEKTLKFGLTCLQIGDNLPLHELSPERQEKFKSLIQKNNIRLEIGARNFTAEHADKYIDLAIFFKSPLLRFVIDGEHYEPDRATIIQIIKIKLPKLKKNKITLGIENHDRFKAKELVEIMESINDPAVGVCLDCVNSIGAGEGLEWVSTCLAPHTVNLHIKDFKIERLKHKMGFHITGTPAGKGMMDVPNLMNKLASYGRCQSGILEQWVEPAVEMESTLKKEQQWAEQGIHFLKQLNYFNANT